MTRPVFVNLTKAIEMYIATIIYQDRDPDPDSFVLPAEMTRLLVIRNNVDLLFS